MVSIGKNGIVQESQFKLLRLHGDCHPGNILWTPTDAVQAAGPGPHFVDLDDARMGPVASTPAQTSRMLAAYRAQWAPVVQKSGYQP